MPPTTRPALVSFPTCTSHFPAHTLTMKTFLLTLLLLTTAAQADQWLVNGSLYKGTLHRLNADRTLVYVTSDWDNYGGSWIKVTALDSATRVRLQVATPEEVEYVKVAQEQQAKAAAQAEARAAADRAARLEEQKLALEREKLALQRQQEARLAAQRSQPSTTQIYIVPGYPQTGYGCPQNGYGYGYGYSYPQTGYGYGYGYPQSGTHHHTHAPGVNVPVVPVSQVPSVPQPIIIRTY